MAEKEIMDKLEEVKKDEAFMKMLGEQDTPEKIQAAFATKGIEFTLDEVKAIVVAVVDQAENNGELNEENLNEVSGGFIISATAIGTALALGGIGLGVAIGWLAAKKKC